MNEFEKSLLAYFTRKQLGKIQCVHAGIAGAGGLGSNCAFNLVRCGFKKMTVCDFDVVETSNLNRQFYFLDQIGISKVEALKSNLLRINPDAEITSYQERITAQNAKILFEKCDAVVEAFDQPVDKKMLAEVYADSERFYVSASGLAGWGNSDEIIVRKISETFCLIGDGKSGVSQQSPPCSPRVNIAAAKEADCVLEWALRDE
ncbi:thiamine biosynthesis protein ThiF [Smithella sp. SCADC]|jgi:sulfur carrier protein ThiS adenylyltransferase|nr:thiamine biosynthesis protein ThiF [Smithella sp. SCADC]HAR49329.1 sulfur carrier protein ThiS adenylyltransferase ThiF [Smithella sp.]